jgi:hypothetical protein
MLTTTVEYLVWQTQFSKQSRNRTIRDYFNVGIIFHNRAYRVGMEVVGMFMSNEYDVDIREFILFGGKHARVSQNPSPIRFNQETAVTNFCNTHIAVYQKRYRQIVIDSIFIRVINYSVCFVLQGTRKKKDA